VLLRDEAGSLHLATERRTGDVLVLTRPGFQVANAWRPCDAAVVPVQPDYAQAGSHGYPAEGEPDMRSIFLAAGPHVRHVDLGVIQQIDVAPTVNALLGVRPPAQAEGRVLQEMVLAQP
jgi:hypothetical protein